MVGLLGGSFDPVHLGHLLVAQAVAERAGLEELRFVPAAQQPLKPEGPVADAAHRLAMLELALAGAPGFRLERDEVERAGPSYSAVTLERLRAREPGRAFCWILGADAARDLPRWHRAAELPGLARFVVVARGGEPVPPTPFPVEVVPVPRIDISATEVRARARAGRSLRWWVPDAVAEYIARHRLYWAP